METDIRDASLRVCCSVFHSSSAIKQVELRPKIVEVLGVIRLINSFDNKWSERSEEEMTDREMFNRDMYKKKAVMGTKEGPAYPFSHPPQRSQWWA